MLLHNNLIRFTITSILCLLYSLLRETPYSTYVKPLPIIFWLLIVLFSERRPEGKWIIYSLTAAFIGDIMLDLGPTWLKLATIPFLGSTALLVVAFHLRGKAGFRSSSLLKETLLILPIAILFFSLYKYIASYSNDAATVGAVLFTLSALLLWRSLSVLIFKDGSEDETIRRVLGVIGACGIIANYVLYAIDLSVQPVNRDLVIQVYYWGQAFVAWSFLKEDNSRTKAHKPVEMAK